MLPRPAVLAALGVLGIAALVIGLQREQLDCDRARGTCELRRGLAGLERVEALALAEISDHRYVTSDSRSGRRGATVLLDREGRERQVALADEATAAASFAALHAFFSGERAQVEIVTGPSPWLIALGLGCLVAIPLVGRGGAQPVPPRAASPTRTGLRASVVALVLAVLVAATVIANIVGSRASGRLHLRCERRCEAGGGTCMPGGEVTLTLAPGEHEVRVYDADAPDTPVVHRVVLAAGELVEFVCAR